MTNNLADRCEAASGADRELDAVIHFAITNGIGCGAYSDAPRYTISIDAALTLVPGGWAVERAGWQNLDPAEPYAGFELWEYRQRNGEWRHGSEEKRVRGEAATPALALCAAALRAKEQINAE